MTLKEKIVEKTELRKGDEKKDSGKARKSIVFFRK